MAQFSLFKPKTKNGYLLQEIASALQKDIRRGNEKEALGWALEMFPEYSNYVWKRLLVISAEDVEDPQACSIVNAFRESFYFSNERRAKGEDYKHRLFITKEVLFLFPPFFSRQEKKKVIRTKKRRHAPQQKKLAAWRLPADR